MNSWYRWKELYIIIQILINIIVLMFKQIQTNVSFCNTIIQNNHDLSIQRMYIGSNQMFIALLEIIYKTMALIFKHFHSCITYFWNFKLLTPNDSPNIVYVCEQCYILALKKKQSIEVLKLLFHTNMNDDIVI
jgi:hypothetical protein